MVLSQTLLKVSFSFTFKTPRCQLTLSFADILFKYILSSSDYIDEGSDFDSSIYFLLALIPEFSCNLRIELYHGGVSRDDSV